MCKRKKGLGLFIAISGTALLVCSGFVLADNTAPLRVPIEQVVNKEEGSEPFTFDFNDFIGERVAVRQLHSKHIRNLKIDILLPPNHKLLTAAKPHVNLFTKKQFIGRFPIREKMADFSVNFEVSSDQLYAELALYYCRQGKTGICLIKKILYEIPLAEKYNPQDLQLTYKVPDFEY